MELSSGQALMKPCWSGVRQEVMSRLNSIAYVWRTNPQMHKPFHGAVACVDTDEALLQMSRSTATDESKKAMQLLRSCYLVYFQESSTTAS